RRQSGDPLRDLVGDHGRVGRPALRGLRSAQSFGHASI
ncbi:hypothetical protein XPN_4447, partial [Xanthomonas arboricola pv. pruni MAFF 301427]